MAHSLLNIKRSVWSTAMRKMQSIIYVEILTFSAIDWKGSAFQNNINYTVLDTTISQEKCRSIRLQYIAMSSSGNSFEKSNCSFTSVSAEF